MTLLTIEIMKLRRSRILLFAAALSLAVVLMASLQLGSATVLTRFQQHPSASWAGHVIGYVFASALLAPLQMSLLASRFADIEHLGGGWRLNAVAGHPPGTLLRVKFAVLGGIIVLLKACEGAAVLFLPHLLGAPANPHLGVALLAGLGMAGTSLALAAIFLCIATLVESQLVVLGIGIIGGFCALAALLSPVWLALINPFGYYAALTPFTFTASGPVTVAQNWLAWCGYVGVAGVVFFLVTHRLNTKEQ